MSVCEACQRAICWAALSNDERKSSSLTFARPSRLGPEATTEHSAKLELLVISSETCALCKFLYQSVPKIQHDAQSKFSVKLIVTGLKSRSLVTALIMELWEPANVDSPGFSRINDSIFSVSSTSNRFLERSIWKPAKTSFSARVAVINSWLHTCFTEHNRCHLARTNYPARFLDIGEEESLNIKLVYSNDVQKTIHFIQYVALSHCWSDSAAKSYTTTKSNLSANLKGIPISELSSTFQDAIKVTRALGLRFLWIDSLCIVQDDKADWAAEAAKMAQVYHGSHVTLAATSSANDGGLHLDSIKASVEVKLSSPANAQSTSSFIRFPAASRKSIWDSNLSSRAWILQEQVLSPRLIHFTENQMFFQCYEGLESEDGTLKDAGLTSLKTNARTVESEADYLGVRDFRTPVLANSSWWSWVVEYSGRSLTFHSDRMAAIAGIVDYHYRSTPVVSNEPLLGLWKDSLWSDLGWQIDDKSDTQVVSELPENIPSWSWLSIPPGITIRPVKTIVNIPKEGRFNTLQLIDWDIKWAGPPFTSNLLTSKLVVLGLLKPLGMALPAARGKIKHRIDFEFPWDEFLDVVI